MRGNVRTLSRRRCGALPAGFGRRAWLYRKRRGFKLSRWLRLFDVCLTSSEHLQVTQLSAVRLGEPGTAREGIDFESGVDWVIGRRAAVPATGQHDEKHGDQYPTTRQAEHHPNHRLAHYTDLIALLAPLGKTPNRRLSVKTPATRRGSALK